MKKVARLPRSWSSTDWRTIVWPHTPDVCYPATGFRAVSPSRDKDLEIRVPEMPTPARFRLQHFIKSKAGQTDYREVCYSFRNAGQWGLDMGKNWKSFRYHPGMFKVQVQCQASSTAKIDEIRARNFSSESSRKLSGVWPQRVRWILEDSRELVLLNFLSLPRPLRAKRSSWLRLARCVIEYSRLIGNRFSASTRVVWPNNKIRRIKWIGPLRKIGSWSKIRRIGVRRMIWFREPRPVDVAPCHHGKPLGSMMMTGGKGTNFNLTRMNRLDYSSTRNVEC